MVIFKKLFNHSSATSHAAPSLLDSPQPGTPPLLHPSAGSVGAGGAHSSSQLPWPTANINPYSTHNSPASPPPIKPRPTYAASNSSPAPPAPAGVEAYVPRAVAHTQQQQHFDQDRVHSPALGFGGEEMFPRGGGTVVDGGYGGGGGVGEFEGAAGVGEGGVDASLARLNANVSASTEAKLSIGIDLGTTYSGVAYGTTRHFSGNGSPPIRQILSWPSSWETYRKIPTCLLYYQPDPRVEARVLAWGLEAKSASVSEGMIKVEWFKLYLSPQVLRDGPQASKARLPALPVGKEPLDVVVDYLRCLWAYAKGKIVDETGSATDLESADVLLTVPAEWDAQGCAQMRTAAIKAGLVQAARGGDTGWRDRLRIITEPEAAAIHASTLESLHRLKPSQSLLICDAGGGTVDVATYKLIGQMGQLEIAEMATREGASCGSLFLDVRFEQLVKSILAKHPIHLDTPSLLAFRHSFSETDKLAYRGAEDDHVMFRFNCFNIEDPNDPSCGLENGELCVPGYVLRRDVFDPVVHEVLTLIALQLDKTPDKPPTALIMVGGFSASHYLFQRVQDAFPQIPLIVRPNDTDVACLQGAARYGLRIAQGKAAVSSVVCPRSYILKVKLPAEPEDKFQRPGFISVNNAGVEVCENRLTYLVAKGAIVRKGQRIASRFCKYSRDAGDSLFTAILFVSDADRVYRYSDEGETDELCRWMVDLASLPAFRMNAMEGGPFYTEFDLGLLIDGPEVRGVLLDDEGREVGAASFEYIR